MAFFSKEYACEWNVGVFNPRFKLKTFITPFFRPLFGNNVKFRFIAFNKVTDSSRPVSFFRLKLCKVITDATISPTLKVDINVRVRYGDGSLLMDYPKSSAQNVSKMNLTYDCVVREMTNKSGGNPTEHALKMARDNIFIYCKMIFSDHQASYTKSSKYTDVMANFKSVYEPSVLSDFTFKVGDRSFPAHKVILAAHSPVFMKMMTQEFLESKTNTVTITDATPETFDSFLRYLYSGEIGDKSFDSLKELFYLANKYDVGFLKKECAPLIIAFLSVDLVCEILQLANTYSDSSIKTVAVNFVMENIKEVVERDDWKELLKTQPMIVYEVMVNFIPS